MNILQLTLTKEVYADAVNGRRTELYCRITPKWITTLVDGVTEQRAVELAWPENRGMLQCGMELGHMQMHHYARAMLVCGASSAVFAIREISVQQMADNRSDVFVIKFGNME